MEFMIAWFWVVKGLFAVILLFLCYKSFIVHKFDSKFWNILTISLIVFYILMPIKIETDTAQRQQMTNKSIENMRKEIPEKKIDNSFEKSVTQEMGITKEDIK